MCHSSSFSYSVRFLRNVKIFEIKSHIWNDIVQSVFYINKVLKVVYNVIFAKVCTHKLKK